MSPLHDKVLLFESDKLCYVVVVVVVVAEHGPFIFAVTNHGVYTPLS